MRYVRRLIAILSLFATWCAASATVAFAQVVARPDPGGGVVVYPSGSTTAASEGTPLWKFFAVAALGALLAIAVVGLIVSLRHRRPSEQPSRMIRA